MKEGKKAYYFKHLISIHIAVLLFGMAGLFGKLILIPAIVIVIGRVFFASAVLGIILGLKRNRSLSIPKGNNLVQLIFLGILLAFHWFSFFHSIQLSTIAIGLLTFATFPVFTTLLEPLVFSEKFEPFYLLIALFSGLGIFLIIPEFQLESAMTRGVIWGVLSGLSFAILSIFNRKMLKSVAALKITFYQDLFAFLVLVPFIFFIDFSITLQDWVLLILLGSVFTALAHFLFINGLSSVKVRNASIISSLEPVYGIVFAMLILNEFPSSKTLIGGLIILACAIFSTVKASR
jgi:drug/metabolite transporter (DMT)-like permease